MSDKIRRYITGITINAPTYHNITFQPTMLNFFYGKNGTGKSTLGRSFKNHSALLTWSDAPLLDEQILVYNEDFIKANIQSYGNIPGVFTISDINAQKKKEADEQAAIKADLVVRARAAQSIAAQVKSSHEQAEQEYITTVWKKTEAIRKKFPTTQTGFMKDKIKFIKKLEETQPLDTTEEECIKLYLTLSDSNQQSYSEFKPIPSVIEPMSEIMRKSIVSRSDTEFAAFIRALGNMDWVAAGHKQFHDKAGGKCPYCQGELPKNFEEMLATCYDEQYKKDLSNLDFYIEEITDLMNATKEVIQRNLQSPFPSRKLDDYRQHTQLLLAIIERNFVLLQKKKDNPAESIIIESLISTSKYINDLTEEINAEIKAYMAVLADIPGQTVKCTKMVWGLMAKECADIISNWKEKTESDREDWRKANDEAKQLIDSANEIERHIAFLNSQTVNTTKAMHDINKAIKNAGFRGFYLQEKAGAKYVYELVRDNSGKPEVVQQNLSEGERNFIAFLYFYHMVMGSQSDEGKVVDKIVIIDDPVSSMDSSSLFIVASLVREMIAVCYNNYDLTKTGSDDHIRQFFCMTHNPYFFREITYNRISDYECASFFEIKKSKDNQTSIAECTDELKFSGGNKVNRSPVRNTYDTLWHEYSYTDDSETLMMIMRQILEYYFIQMVGFKSGNLRRELLDVNEKEFVKELDDGTEDRTDYIAASAMIAMLNVGATGFNDGLYYDSSAVSVDSLRDVFERIFKVMHQEQHFQMMTGKR